MAPLRYLIVGTGRCGTVYLARLLTSLGIPCGHERVFTGGDVDACIEAMRSEGRNSACSASCGHDLAQYGAAEVVAESSYLAAPFLDDKRLRTCRVIHVVRHPVRVLLSFLNDIGFFRHQRSLDVTHSHERFVYERLPSLERYESPVLRACHYYIEWNRMIERSANDANHLLFPVESDPQKLFEFLGVCPRGDYFHQTTCNTYRQWPDHLRPDSPDELYTAEDIFRCRLAAELIETAERYGYRSIDREAYETPLRDERHRGAVGAPGNTGSSSRPGVPRLVERNYCRFNIVSFGGTCYALSRTIGPVNVAELTEAETRRLVTNGLCFVGRSPESVKLQVVAGQSGAVETVSNQGCDAFVVDACWHGPEVPDGGASGARRIGRTAA